MGTSEKLENLAEQIFPDEIDRRILMSIINWLTPDFWLPLQRNILFGKKRPEEINLAECASKVLDEKYRNRGIGLAKQFMALSETEKMEVQKNIGVHVQLKFL